MGESGRRGRVAGKAAFVTGAARGLGYAIAEQLIEEGAVVFISDVNGDAVVEAGRLLGCAGSFTHDVSSDVDWRRSISASLEIAGRIDILVNNAGIARAPGPSDVEHVTPEAWSRVVAVNGLGVLLGCQHVLPGMKAASGGSIVNLSSAVVRGPSPTIAAYGFSKAGVSHLTRSVAQLGAPFGIRCNAVLPGMIRTQMFEELQSYHLDLSGADAELARQAFASAIPMGQFQTEHDIAAAVLFLASDEARFVTGGEFVVDGGMTL
jgi:NAD(P)-dependent dehydrogenase (short-subunit alcohol dehydrogenase family)